MHINCTRHVAELWSDAAVVVQEEGYEEALKCDGTELDGQQLRVQKCLSAGKNGAKKREGQASGLGAVEASPTVQTQQPAAPKVAFPHSPRAGPHSGLCQSLLPPHLLPSSSHPAAREKGKRDERNSVCL